MSAITLTRGRHVRSVLDRDVEFRRPPARIVAAAIAMLPFLRPSLEDGNVSGVDAFIVLAVVSSLLWLGTAGEVARFPLFLGVALYVAAGALAAGLGRHPATGLVSVIQDIVLFVWAFGIANVCRTPRVLRLVISAWVWASIGWAVLMIVGVLGGFEGLAGQEVAGGRASLTFLSPNQAGNYFAISLLLLLASASPTGRYTRIAGVVILTMAVLYSASNAALGGLLAALVVAFVLRVARRHGYLSAILAGSAAFSVILILAFAILRFDLIDRASQSDNAFVRTTLGRSERSAGDRLVRFDQLQALYRTGGVVGYGAAATKSELEAQGYTNAKSAHNDYIATLVERGALGTLGLVLIGASLAMLTVPIASRRLAPGFRSAVRDPSYLVAGLVVVALGAVSHEVLHFRHVWALFGIIAAVSLWAREETRIFDRSVQT